MQAFHHADHALLDSVEFPDLGSSSDFPALGDTLPSRKPKVNQSAAQITTQSLSGRVMAGSRRIGGKPITEDFPALETSNPRGPPPGNLMNPPKTVLSRPPVIDNTFSTAAPPNVSDASLSYSAMSRTSYIGSSTGAFSEPVVNPQTQFMSPQNPRLNQPLQFQTNLSYPSSRTMPSSSAPAPSIELSPSSSDVSEYGLKGLLKIIRMSDLDLNTLALGTDLTTLGLDLNSTEYVFIPFCLILTFALEFYIRYLPLRSLTRPQLESQITNFRNVTIDTLLLLKLVTCLSFL